MMRTGFPNRHHVAANRRCDVGRSGRRKHDGGRTSGRQRCPDQRGDARANDGMERVRQRLWLGQRGEIDRWRKARGQAEWAIQSVVDCCLRPAVVINDDELDGTTVGADQFHGLGRDPRRCEGHAQRQQQPRQDEADHRGRTAQPMHSTIIHSELHLERVAATLVSVSACDDTQIGHELAMAGDTPRYSADLF